MVKYIQSILLLVFLPLAYLASGQEVTSVESLKWKGIIEEQTPQGIELKYMYFEDAMIDPGTSLPLFTYDFNVDHVKTIIYAELQNTEFISCTPEEIDFLQSVNYSETDINIKHGIVSDRNNPIAHISFIPIRKNSASGLFEKLISFEIHINTSSNHPGTKSTTRVYSDHSVLSSGEWFKVRVSESGIYRITYDDLLNFGIDPASVDPSRIGVFGNAGGMLPEKNSIFRYDDLQENSIFVEGENDGSFDEEDYILFYGMSPHTWISSLGVFLYQVHYYDDYNYYFLTVTEGSGKRVETEIQTTSPVSSTSQQYNNFKIIEEEKRNLIYSGKRWYGDEFGEINSRTYQFHFPEIKDDEQIVIKTEVANRTFINDELVIKVNGLYSDTVTLTSVDPGSTKYAQYKRKTINYTNLGPEINVELEYLPAEPGSRMWLDYINVNVISHLNFIGDQLLFRDLHSIADGATTRFAIGNASEGTRVWEVSNPLDPVMMITEFDDGTASIIADTDSLRTFIAFKTSGFKTPEFVSEVPNQDLHSSGPADYIVVTHPLFRDQANQLAQLHEEHDGFSYIVVEPESIYNEFSSGKQDPTAIRDYLKLLYDKYPSQPPKYLLLFGDGSFDPKDRLEHNTNLIPTFQTDESWVTATSYIVDDYFGLLDDEEGDDAVGYLDIGIGRLPVNTTEEAQQLVDKIIRYISPGEEQFGSWRSKLSMIADDEDGNLHIEQADSLADGEGFVTPVYNQNKIYLDAYPQLRTPSGDKYPDVTEAINKQVEEGALIINYIGHGGTGGWAHERILEQNDMLNWTNNKLPLFITATCEFSRFDEPELVSGGELVILNPEGGGIGLFTTTRLAYSQSNFRLNQRLYARAFVPVEGEMPYLGDLIRESKPPGQLTTRNFVLLGDPAVKLNYPKYNVQTTSFNGIAVEEIVQDTVKALQQITVEGQIEDYNGQLISSFNGILEIEFYDKPAIYNTIGNDANSFPVDFYSQDKVLWKGKATVENGRFKVSFVVPRDIAYNFGNAKLSYYAYSENEDAHGFFNNFTLGGLDENAPQDNQGPTIRLYINDTTFISGNQTHENPVLLAYLSDEHGINQSQNGIGHDITLVLNDDYSNVMVLNDHYKYNLDDFSKGFIEYPFFNLPNGTHTLTLKAWDSYNNASTQSIDFVINRDSELILSEVKNYPNPFYEETTFTFKHSRPGDKLTIEIFIYDLYGRYLLSYETAMYSANTEVPFLTWNGRDRNGSKLEEGIYIYNIRITDEKGQVETQQQKLILSK